jgi:DNA-binding CsgD family transcriptional regulator/tetratricopeptide (TPR) repeat protein
VDKSLVVGAVQEQAHQTRYHLLETLRQYAAERLAEAGEREALRDRHLEHFLAFAEQAEPELRGANVVVWLDRLQMEHDNFREALSWALQRDQRSEERARQAMAFAAALEPFWRIRSHLSEGRRWLESALVQSFGRGPSPERLRALVAAARLAWLWGDPSAVRAYLQESQVLAQELGPAGRRGLARSLLIEGRLLWSYGHPMAARPLLEQSLALFRDSGDALGIADALWHLGTVAPVSHPVVARDFLEQSLAVYQQQGDLWSAARVLQSIARLSFSSGDRATAQRLYDESLAIDRMLGFKPGVASTLFDLGRTWRFQGDCEAAQACYNEGAALSQEIGWIAGDETIHFAYLAMQQGDLPQATSLFRDGIAYCAQDPAGLNSCLTGLAGVSALTGQPRRAARLMGMADGLRERTGTEVGWCDGPDHRRELDRVRAALDPAIFAAEWATGHAQDTEAALEYAAGEAAVEVQTPATRMTPLRAAKAQFGGLTARERQVAALVARGKSNRDIAVELVVSERTAEAHITNILAKLDLASRTQIVAWTIAKGLVILEAN